MLSFIRYLFFLVCAKLKLQCKKIEKPIEISHVIETQNNMLVYNSKLID